MKKPQATSGVKLVKNTAEDLLYPFGFTLPHETQTKYASPSQPISSYPYRPSQVIQTIGLVLCKQNTNANIVNPLMILDFDDPAKKEKLHQNEA